MEATRNSEYHDYSKLDIYEKKKLFVSWLEESGFVKRNENGDRVFAAKWNRKEDRVLAIRKMVEILGIEPHELTSEHFEQMGLVRLLVKYVNRAYFPVFAALTEAYPELGIKPWEVKIEGDGVWPNSTTARSGVKVLLESKGNVISDDSFNENEHKFILSQYRNLFEAVIFSKYTSISPYSMHSLAQKYMDESFITNDEKRHAAIKFIVGLKGSFREVSYSDFKDYGIEKVVDFYSKGLTEYGELAKEEIENMSLALALKDTLTYFDVRQMKNPSKILLREAKRHRDTF
ncbi:MAG: hypothetical protein QXZ38_02970 [Candidatus Micrarchaeaceae archaeon]